MDLENCSKSTNADRSGNFKFRRREIKQRNPSPEIGDHFASAASAKFLDLPTQAKTKIDSNSNSNSNPKCEKGSSKLSTFQITSASTNLKKRENEAWSNLAKVLLSQEKLPALIREANKEFLIFEKKEESYNKAKSRYGLAKRKAEECNLQQREYRNKRSKTCVQIEPLLSEREGDFHIQLAISRAQEQLGNLTCDIKIELETAESRRNVAPSEIVQSDSIRKNSELRQINPENAALWALKERRRNLETELKVLDGLIDVQLTSMISQSKELEDHLIILNSCLKAERERENASLQKKAQEDLSLITQMNYVMFETQEALKSLIIEKRELLQLVGRSNDFATAQAGRYLLNPLFQRISQSFLEGLGLEFFASDPEKNFLSLVSIDKSELEPNLSNLLELCIRNQRVEVVISRLLSGNDREDSETYEHLDLFPLTSSEVTESSERSQAFRSLESCGPFGPRCEPICPSEKTLDVALPSRSSSLESTSSRSPVGVLGFVCPKEFCVGSEPRLSKTPVSPFGSLPFALPSGSTEGNDGVSSDPGPSKGLQKSPLAGRGSTHDGSKYASLNDRQAREKLDRKLDKLKAVVDEATKSYSENRSIFDVDTPEECAAARRYSEIHGFVVMRLDEWVPNEDDVRIPFSSTVYTDANSAPGTDTIKCDFPTDVGSIGGTNGKPSDQTRATSALPPFSGSGLPPDGPKTKAAEGKLVGEFAVKDACSVKNLSEVQRRNYASKTTVRDILQDLFSNHGRNFPFGTLYSNRDAVQNLLDGELDQLRRDGTDSMFDGKYVRLDFRDFEGVRGTCPAEGPLLIKTRGNGGTGISMRAAVEQLLAAYVEDFRTFFDVQSLTKKIQNSMTRAYFSEVASSPSSSSSCRASRTKRDGEGCSSAGSNFSDYAEDSIEDDLDYGAFCTSANALTKIAQGLSDVELNEYQMLLYYWRERFVEETLELSPVEERKGCGLTKPFFRTRSNYEEYACSSFAAKHLKYLDHFVPTLLNPLYCGSREHSTMRKMFVEPCIKPKVADFSKPLTETGGGSFQISDSSSRSRKRNSDLLDGGKKPNGLSSSAPRSTTKMETELFPRAGEGGPFVTPGGRGRGRGKALGIGRGRGSAMQEKSDERSSALQRSDFLFIKKLPQEKRTPNPRLGLVGKNAEIQRNSIPSLSFSTGCDQQQQQQQSQSERFANSPTSMPSLSLSMGGGFGRERPESIILETAGKRRGEKSSRSRAAPLGDGRTKQKRNRDKDGNRKRMSTAPRDCMSSDVKGDSHSGHAVNGVASDVLFHPLGQSGPALMLRACAKKPWCIGTGLVDCETLNFRKENGSWCDVVSDNVAIVEKACRDLDLVGEAQGFVLAHHSHFYGKKDKVRNAKRPSTSRKSTETTDGRNRTAGAGCSFDLSADDIASYPMVYVRNGRIWGPMGLATTSNKNQTQKPQNNCPPADQSEGIGAKGNPPLSFKSFPPKNSKAQPEVRQVLSVRPSVSLLATCSGLPLIVDGLAVDPFDKNVQLDALYSGATQSCDDLQLDQVAAPDLLGTLRNRLKQNSTHQGMIALIGGHAMHLILGLHRERALKLLIDCCFLLAKSNGRKVCGAGLGPRSSDRGSSIGGETYEHFGEMLEEFEGPEEDQGAGGGSDRCSEGGSVHSEAIRRRANLFNSLLNQILSQLEPCSIRIPTGCVCVWNAHLPMGILRTNCDAGDCDLPVYEGTPVSDEKEASKGGLSSEFAKLLSPYGQKAWIGDGNAVRFSSRTEEPGGSFAPSSSASDPGCRAFVPSSASSPLSWRDTKLPFLGMSVYFAPRSKAAKMGLLDCDAMAGVVVEDADVASVLAASEKARPSEFPALHVVANAPSTSSEKPWLLDFSPKIPVNFLGSYGLQNLRESCWGSPSFLQRLEKQTVALKKIERDRELFRTVAETKEPPGTVADDRVSADERTLVKAVPDPCRSTLVSKPASASESTKALAVVRVLSSRPTPPRRASPTAPPSPEANTVISTNIFGNRRFHCGESVNDLYFSGVSFHRSPANNKNKKCDQEATGKMSAFYGINDAQKCKEEARMISECTDVEKIKKFPYFGLFSSPCSLYVVTSNLSAGIKMLAVSGSSNVQQQQQQQQPRGGERSDFQFNRSSEFATEVESPARRVRPGRKNLRNLKMLNRSDFSDGSALGSVRTNVGNGFRGSAEVGKQGRHDSRNYSRVPRALRQGCESVLLWKRYGDADESMVDAYMNVLQRARRGDFLDMLRDGDVEKLDAAVGEFSDAFRFLTTLQTCLFGSRFLHEYPGLEYDLEPGGSPRSPGGVPWLHVESSSSFGGETGTLTLKCNVEEKMAVFNSPVMWNLRTGRPDRNPYYSAFKTFCSFDMGKSDGEGSSSIFRRFNEASVASAPGCLSPLGTVGAPTTLGLFGECARRAFGRITLAEFFKLTERLPSRLSPSVGGTVDATGDERIAAPLSSVLRRIYVLLTSPKMVFRDELFLHGFSEVLACIYSASCASITAEEEWTVAFFHLIHALSALQFASGWFAACEYSKVLGFCLGSNSADLQSGLVSCELSVAETELLPVPALSTEFIEKSGELIAQIMDLEKNFRNPAEIAKVDVGSTKAQVAPSTEFLNFEDGFNMNLEEQEEEHRLRQEMFLQALSQQSQQQHSYNQEQEQEDQQHVYNDFSMSSHYEF